MNATIKKLGYIPEHIMINVPDAFFKHQNKEGFGESDEDRENAFRRFYETMGQRNDDDCFYHFISCCPTIQVAHVYICFKGKVQYKAIVVTYLKNQAVMLPTYQHPEPRDWIVTTGPVVKAPFEISQRGFRGFRYCKELF